jgi:hypothetical protein
MLSAVLAAVETAGYFHSSRQTRDWFVANDNHLLTNPQLV